MIEKPPHISYISFATREFSEAANAAKRAARAHGLPNVTLYSPESPVIGRLSREHPEVMSRKRGAGYWMWKPFIIEDAFNKLREGDILLYADAGMALVADPLPLFELTRLYPILLFEMEPYRLQRFWTKRDCFILNDADSPEYWNAPQLLAGVQVYRVCDGVRSFIQEYKNAICNKQALCDDDNILGKPNFPGYKEHRHDQSILSILARRHRLPLFPDPTQPNLVPRDEQRDTFDGIPRPGISYRRLFNLHRIRNNNFFVNMSRRLRKKYS